MEKKHAAEEPEDLNLTQGEIDYSISLYGKDYANHPGFREWRRRLHERKSAPSTDGSCPGWGGEKGPPTRTGWGC